MSALCRAPAALVAVAIAAAIGCGRRDADRDPAPAPGPPAAPSPAEPSAPAPAVKAVPVAPVHAAEPAGAAAPGATRAAVLAALARLEEILRPAAGDPESPWKLAHGLLAFGKDHTTRDGRSAALVAASFAQPRRDERSGATRYGFPVERQGKPVEPHPHLLVKTFLEVGVDRALTFDASDATRIDVNRLISDMRAGVREPQSDPQWHDAAWWLAALELDAAAQPASQLAALRAAALARLERDDAVLEAQAAEPFHPSAPMGAAKRGKTHIYGHPCGGLHFVQAVLRGAGANGSPDERARARRQVSLLVRRYEAERALYAETLRSHPAAKLLVSGQQLKFFGHLLETLALADELGVLRGDEALAQHVTEARRAAAADLLTALAQLHDERAYARLPELAVQMPQLHLDLIGDGCHAIHGLRKTLAVLPP